MVHVVAPADDGGKMRSTASWSIDIAAIDRARILRGWTRRELGRVAHVDEGTLCDLFAGRRRPNFGTLRAICSALALGIEDVISFDAALGGHVRNPETYP